jgi:hypothetical protein
LCYYLYLVKLKSSLRKFYGRHHDLVVRYGTSVSQNDNGNVPLVVNTSRSFPHSGFITGLLSRLTRRVSLVEQELLTLPEHLNSPTVFSEIHCIRSLVLCACFVDRCLSFCLFVLAIVWSVLLWFTDSDYPFGIFKLFSKYKPYLHEVEEHILNSFLTCYMQDTNKVYI